MSLLYTMFMRAMPRENPAFAVHVPALANNYDGA